MTLADTLTELVTEHGPHHILNTLARIAPDTHGTDQLAQLMCLVDNDGLRRLNAHLDRQISQLIARYVHHEPPLAALAALVAAIDRAADDTRRTSPRAALDRLRSCDELTLARRLTKDT